MNIFESLENLNVSEECFDDIMDIVESLINGIKKQHEGHREKLSDEEWYKRRDAYKRIPKGSSSRGYWDKQK